MARDVCYYDGRCGRCRWGTERLRRLDWLGRLEFRDLNTAADLPVPMDVALSGMPMRTRSGRVLVGFPALRRALLLTPAGFIAAAVMYIPGISQWADRRYRRVAEGRAREACPVHGVRTNSGTV